MTETEAKQQATELGNLAKLLFDRAVFFWYSAVGIEIVAGLLAVGAGLATLSDKVNVLLAVIGFLLFASAHYFKILFEKIYDNAETMRRQSVLADALGWSITKVQFSEWRQLAGKKILQKFGTQNPDPAYYATSQTTGSRRLLEMTQESAFWTRHLYTYLQSWVWGASAFFFLLFFLVITFAASNIVQSSTALKIVYAVYLLLPLVLSLDMLKWALRLGHLIGSIKQIEGDLETLESEQNLTEPKVLRLVSEYNCQVVAGFPIPKWFFKRHHDEIDSLWKSSHVPTS